MHKSLRRLTMAAMIGLALLTTTGCQVPNTVLNKRAAEAIERHELGRAEGYLTRAVAQNSRDWLAYYQLGIVRMQLRRPLDAQLSLEKALTLNPHGPETPGIIDLLAESLLAQDKSTHLVGLLEQCAREYGMVEDYVRMAKFESRMGDVDGARLALNKAAAIADPADPTPYEAMLSFYESLGNGEMATVALRHLYYLRPNDPELANALRRYGLVPGPTVGLPPRTSLEGDILKSEPFTPTAQPIDHVNPKSVLPPNQSTP
ncbi:MAG: tetratricopeptide repeat protein [Phycisphaeraceae bacterium]|nr:tetratricopeptide repeat protein [Phycisphaeraceae bacterium]